MKRKTLIKYLNDELLRTKGTEFSDFTKDEQNRLIELYNKYRDIKKAVEIWTFE